MSVPYGFPSHLISTPFTQPLSSPSYQPSPILSPPRQLAPARYSETITERTKITDIIKANPSLLPTAAIAQAAQTVLQDPSISVPALCYGPDPGYQPLREEISKWLSDFYGDDDPTSQQQHGQSTQNALSDSKPVETSATGQAPPESSEGGDRICITGGASQNLACVLQVFSDPVKTKRVWMVAPCYFLACRIFEDGGLRLSAVAEGEDGIDLVGLEKAILQVEKEETGNEVKIIQLRFPPLSKI